MKLPDLIRARLQTLSRSHSEAARMAGLPRRSFLRYLDGTRCPPPEKWSALAKAIDVHPTAIGQAIAEGLPADVQP